MSTHTPGRLHSSFGPIGGKGTWVIGGRSPKSGHPRVYDIAVLAHNPEAEGNAERIVALWNAFVGVPTDEIESVARRGKSS